MKDYVVVLSAIEAVRGLEAIVDQELYTYELQATSYQDALDQACAEWESYNNNTHVLLHGDYIVIEGKVVHS